MTRRDREPRPPREHREPEQPDARGHHRERRSADEAEDDHGGRDERRERGSASPLAPEPGTDDHRRDREADEPDRARREVEQAARRRRRGIRGADREPAHGIGREDRRGEQADAVEAEEDGRPHVAATRHQPREADRRREHHEAAEHEVQPLDPAERAEQQQAQGMPREVESRHEQRLRQADDDVERTGHDAPAEERLRDRATPVEGRGGRGGGDCIGHRAHLP